MADPPKAHRRLVPRKPRKTEDPIEHAEPDDPTIQRPSLRQSGLDLDDLEVTARRAPAPPAPDDVAFDDLRDAPTNVLVDDDDEHDAAETFAIPVQAPPQGSFVLAAPEALPEQRPVYAKQQGLPIGLDAASARFRPSATQHDEPVIPDPSPEAFADLEPTTLKAPSPDAEDRPTTHISPAERGLLAAMAEGHEASRMVYMQWLERRGEKVRAEFLKLDSQLATMNPLDLRYQETQDRMRELANKISVDWRSRVARSVIEGCAQSQCPRYWRALPAEADDVRHCKICNTAVYYCASIELARHYAIGGQPVAVDVTVERRPEDLDPHCGMCGNTVPRGTRFCPHCGRSMY